MGLQRKDFMNEAYDAALVTLGVLGISFLSSKLMKDGLGVNKTTTGVLKLGAAITAGTMAVHYLQEKDYIPENPFK